MSFSAVSDGTHNGFRRGSIHERQIGGDRGRAMLIPAGYLDELRAEVERLGVALSGFLERAPEHEIKAAENAFGPVSEHTSDGGPEHAVHHLIAQWTFAQVSATPGERPDIKIDHLWRAIEGFLKGVVGDILHHGVGPTGTIYGFEKYEVFDAEWIKFIIGWLEYSPSSGKIATLPKGGAVVSMPDDVTIAVVGDWGTGVDYPTQTAGHVASAIKGWTPDFSVHLGDVYYDGVEQEQNFLDPWEEAAGSTGSFTLNSNHDMYDGANGYLHTTLNDGRFFAKQDGKTYFALHNSSWVIVGLDTAGPASWEELYLHGNVDDDQLAFLADQARTDKRLIVLTHHQGINESTAEPNDPLHTKIVDCVEQNRPGSEPWFWYWGHIHAGYVHTDQAAPYRGRCAGHGAIPWGNARGLGDNPAIEWYEQTPSQIGHHRVTNGFALLTLSGDTLKEQFVDETGAVTYTLASNGA